MNHRRLDMLRDILFFKWILTLFIWGLPALLGPRELLDIISIPIPDNIIFVRLFGAVVTVQSLLYWYAWKDPLAHSAILKFAIAENGIVTLTLWAVAFFIGLSGWFIWTSSFLTAFFFFALIILFPRKQNKHAVVRSHTEYE